MNILIINFNGIGDGIIEIPFILRLQHEILNINIFHNSTTLFTDKDILKKFGANITSLTPAEWKNFKPNHWKKIRGFILNSNIDLIINFRNLGPLHDKDYFEFKKAHPSLKFLDLDFEYIQNNESKNIRYYIEKMLFEYNILDKKNKTNHILPGFKENKPYNKIKKIGLSMNTGSKLKEWDFDKWKNLGKILLLSGYNIFIFKGYSQEEVARAFLLEKYLKAINTDNVLISEAKNISDTLDELKPLDLLISVDSGLLHASTGLAVRTLGIYTTTSSITWGGSNSVFYSVESPHMKNCPYFDKNLGICRNNRTICPLINKDGDDVEINDIINKLEEIQNII